MCGETCNSSRKETEDTFISELIDGLQQLKYRRDWKNVEEVDRHIDKMLSLIERR